MMRNSVHSWAQEPWPMLDNSLDMTNFDSNSFLNADQVLQLHDLFGQDQLDFDGEASLLYDEFTFESNMVDTIEPSNLTTNESYIMNTIVNEPEKKRRNSTSSNSSLSSCSSSSSSSSSSEEEDTEDFLSISNNQDASDSSDSEVEQEVISPYLHRRQMEEMILDKITNHLDPEKLPGILTIISKSHEEVEEVEIDLAKLDRDQLNRILAYVNDCLLEKEGGPKVQISNYTIQLSPSKPVSTSLLTTTTTTGLAPKKSPKPSTSRRRRNNSKRRKSIVEEGHVVNGSSTSRLSSTHGPISMSALTEIESSSTSKKKNSSSRRKRVTKKMKKDDDVSVHMPTDLNSFKDSIASTKPKRRTAVHKRRLLEDMLRPSSDDDSSSEEDNNSNTGIIVFGDEQMDLAVTQNETIIHQEQKPTTVVEQKKIQEEMNNIIDSDDDDELIDIMM